MSGTYSRSRFFQLPKYDACLSSRFGDIPAYMERDPLPPQPSYFSQSSLSPHVVLPPIKYRRFGVDNNQDFTFHLRKQPNIINSMSHHAILDNLLSTMPDLHRLPEVPITITPDQENAILLETNYQLSNFDANNLKELYISLTNADPELIGCIGYEDLLFNFQRKQVPITEQLLLLVAAQFVSRKERMKVNYEKLLSFLGAALKLHKSGSSDEHFATHVSRAQRCTPRDQDRLRSPGKVVYYHDSSCPNDEETGSSYTEKDDPEILRLLENCVRHQFTPINLESLRLSFQRADRLLRGTLSEQQIKDLCYQHDVRMDDSIIERVIHRCKQRGGGQYDWQQFIRYIERVQPVQTGLTIKASRMPHDFVKYVPHPSSSWPHAESSSAWGNPILHHHHNYNPPVPLYRDFEEVDNSLPPPLASNRNYGVQTSEINNENFDPLLLKLNQLQREVNEMTDRSQVVEDRNPTEIFSNTQPDISQYDERLLRPWFDRFMEMADCFYKSDFNSSGALNESKIIEITDRYNKLLNLQLKREDIRSALFASQKSHGSIDINNYLKLLAVKN